MASYLVTGGAGFIGSHLVEALLNRQQQVRVLDNFSTGRRANLTRFLGRFELIEGDIRDLSTVRAAAADVDFILHLAALPSVTSSISDPILSNEVNINGVLNILVAARDAGVKRVVFSSSCAVYGDNPVLPNREDSPTQPLSPYAVAKLTGENYCQVFSRVYNLPTISLRYFNVFGPRQDPTSEYSAVIPKFITQMLAGRSPTIYGDGLQSRDFIYVENVVEANLLAAAAPPHVSGSFNVACGQSCNLLDLVREIQEVLDSKIEPVFAPERSGEIKHSTADIARIKQALNYQPRIVFEDALKLTAQYFIAAQAE